MNTQFHDTTLASGSYARRTAVPARRPAFVYTLHFRDGGLPHGKQAATLHYTGMTSNLDARLKLHRSGYSGAVLMAECYRRGVLFDLVALYQCESVSEARALERRLKKHSATRRCPLCCRKPVDDLVFMRQGHYRLQWRSAQARARRPMAGGRVLL